ncbi:MAG: hypothetical protein OD814_001464 [Candidatus Alkanophagales archaeon MCA70_species_1]|nr:hypothetical protein [Candidatus Alkanophaga volatiphilum]
MHFEVSFPQGARGSPEWAFMDKRSVYYTYVPTASGLPKYVRDVRKRRTEVGEGVTAVLLKVYPPGCSL